MVGPSARLLASKMDFFDGISDASILAARAQTEAEEWERQLELEAADAGDRMKIKKGTKARVKHKSERGKGNFSDFRNKTFITPGLKNKVARSDNNEFKKLPTLAGKVKHRSAKNDKEDDYVDDNSEESDESIDDEDDNNVNQEVDEEGVREDDEELDEIV
jgi:hypothetical protein